MSIASILVVEDEALLGRMICDNLKLDGHIPEHVQRGDIAVERMRESNYDLVILDVMLPGLSGIEVLKSMRNAGDDTPVIVLSALASDADRIRGLEHKADDYLTKPFNLKELLLRVHALLRRGRASASPQGPVHIGANTFDFANLSLATANGDVVKLSPTEGRLLHLLHQRAGQAVSRDELVTTLFGPATPPTARTLDNVVSRLRKMIERDAAHPTLLETVRGVGYRLAKTPDLT